VMAAPGKEWFAMCDYSLDQVASRPARVGDRLVSTTFLVTASRGFAAVGERGVAVCLQPGTELAFEREVRHSDILLGAIKKNTRQKTAVFCRIDRARKNTHHDALAFPDGQVVLVTRLCPGQRAVVLQLPAGVRPEPEAEGRARDGADRLAHNEGGRYALNEG
jgi:hypothetical protein